MRNLIEFHFCPYIGSYFLCPDDALSLYLLHACCEAGALLFFILYIMLE